VTGDEQTVADVVVERLSAWGVTRIFGYSGDGINGVMAALQRAGAPEFVQARHEEAAAFMACAHAKYTGTVGVCTSTQGPGAVHLLNGLYDAKLDHQPVVAIVGQQRRSVLGSAYQQEIDLQVLYKDVASAFLQTASTPEQVPMLVDRAIRVALATRQPTCVILPHDVQTSPAADLSERAHGLVPGAVGYEPARPVADATVLDRVTEVLDAGERVAILIGAGARDAADEVAELADRLGAGVATALLGKGVLDERLPFVTGALGHLGTTASWELMSRCDTLLMVGTSEPWTEFLPAPGQARGIQIDIDGRNLGVRYPTELNVVGDARETMRAILDRVGRKDDRTWREQVEGWAHRSPHPDAPGVPPYAVAAKSAMPDRLVVALSGDGAMQMLGISELVTVSRAWRSWSDPRLPILVLNNGDLAEVSWEQREMEGVPRWPTSQDLPDFPYARYAELLGMGGIRVDDPADVGSAWDQALRADRPVLIEAMVDPNVPLLPPHLPEATRQQLHDAIAAEGPVSHHVEEQLALQALQPIGTSSSA